MSLIDTTYFWGEILITNKTHISTSLESDLDLYEKEILIKLLGYELYQLVINNQNDAPYKALIEGAEFEMTFDGITQTLKWEGLKNASKLSLIADYAYFKWQEKEYIQPSGVGTIKPDAENGVIISPNSKMVNAWNRMIESYGYFGNYWFARSNAKIIKPTEGMIFDNYPSAYNYLLANISDFPKWIFTPLRMINHFSI